MGDGFLDGVWFDILTEYGPGAFGEALTRWAEATAKPLVLLIDEIDALLGDVLLSVLRQLRAGYVRRPGSFPQSVVLCGVRDVRDYRIRSRAENAVIAGGSAFNIKARSLRLGDFSRSEVLALLGQHTEETGQGFTADAQETIWTQTQGQPWLVNALADETCFGGEGAKDRQRPITAEAILEAREQLILRRETHLDQLVDKLQEDRVRRIVEPLLSGGEDRDFSAGDLEYTRDLGLVAKDEPLRIANPIYAEVVPRETDLRRTGRPCGGRGLVRHCRWWLGCGRTADRVSDLLPRALRALGRAIPVQGSRPATVASSVFATDREQRRAH